MFQVDKMLIFSNVFYDVLKIIFEIDLNDVICKIKIYFENKLMLKNRFVFFIDLLYVKYMLKYLFWVQCKFCVLCIDYFNIRIKLIL